MKSGDRTYACSCGDRHFTLPSVEEFIERFGFTVKVTTPAGTWRVPRIYIAVHGLRASDVPMLAEAYGWKREKPSKPRNRKRR